MIKIFSNLLTKIYIVFLGFTPSIIFADIQVQDITQQFTSLKDFQIAYYVDQTSKASFEQILDKQFTPAKNSLSLGPSKKTSWIKIILKNTENLPTTISLHNPYAYHNRNLDLYEVVSNKLVNKRLINMDDPKTHRWLFRGSAVFDIELAAKQQKTLFIRSVSFTHQWFTFNLYSEIQSKKALSGQFSDIAIVVGMFLALIIYNILLFVTSHTKEHFYYACYLICSAIWIAFIYGLFSNLFDIYGLSTMNWHLMLSAMPVFLILFMMNIFETKKKYPIEHNALTSLLVLISIIFIVGIFNIINALELAIPISAIIICVTSSVAVSMCIRKQPISILFLVGHGIYSAFGALSVLFYKGIVEFNYITSHGVGIGILIEALILSLVIAQRLRLLESLKATQADLQKLASTDPLTKLLNRRSFHDLASKILKQAKVSQQLTCIAIIDIDHFKKINDTYGHNSGDKAIQYVTKIIQKQTREQDLLARYGGEEFIILMPNTELKDAFETIERVRQKLESTTIQIQASVLLTLKVSAGIAQVAQEVSDLEETINQADKALYRAKNNGRNQSQIA